MSNVVISVENVSKLYRLGTISSGTLSHDLNRAWARLRGKPDPLLKIGQEDNSNRVGEYIWALRDVSFEVKQGEILGIIGRNGAGKSTLLKILSRITAPTNGQVAVKGRVGSLLEVGTGFHPELTGRENIYLNGAILGMKRAEIDRKFDEIVAFAEIKKFLDTPVKRYSSGMYVRLAFAVAAHLDPEILVVDEVLAVGDAAFQKKCLGKMGEVAKAGRTVLFVSHNMGAINRLCPHSIWLESGIVKGIDHSDSVVNQYLSSTYANLASRKFPPRPNGKGQIISVRLLNDNGQEVSDLASGGEPLVQVKFRLTEAVRGCHIACIVSSSDGYHLFSTADTDTNSDLFGERKPGDYLAQVQLPIKHLNTGTYHIAVGLGIPGIESFDRQDAVSFTIHDTGDFGTLKEGYRRAGLLLMEANWKYLEVEQR